MCIRKSGWCSSTPPPPPACRRSWELLKIMPKVTYIEHDGTVHTVEAELGATVMETALRNDVSSIVAECGGGCTCATCHVYVDEAWTEKVGAPSPQEETEL